MLNIKKESEKMIYTGNYKNCNTHIIKTYSISEDNGKKALYDGPCIEELIPNEEIVEQWENNTYKLSKIANDVLFIKNYYEDILKNLDPIKIYQKANNSILLNYPRNDKFCYRHIVSAWLEYFLNIKSYEVKIKDQRLITIERPEYIKEYLYKIIDNKPLIRKKKI